MSFLEGLFGSQYYELQQKGKDGNKGRMNGNLFLAALAFLFVLAVILCGISFVPGFEKDLNQKTEMIFGKASGRSAGKLTLFPVFALFYFIFSITAGTKTKYANYVSRFMQHPDEVKKNAMKKVIIPFFILGVIVFGLAMRQAF